MSEWIDAIGAIDTTETIETNETNETNDTTETNETNETNDTNKPSTAFPNNTHPANQPDEYVKCPYFPEHELRRSRMPYHLLKCQSNPNAPKLAVCPYNYLHRFKMEKMREHVILCENKPPRRIGRPKLPSFETTKSKQPSRTLVKTRHRDIPPPPLGNPNKDYWS